ncbi:RNA-dependent ATPase rok1 [Ascosphaera acerosa]|nr:RNA-dependent ATPase rok1 [Ascosphaera acerosa]
MPGEATPSQADDEVDPVPDEEDRKAILNSHKIKVTDLRPSAREALRSPPTPVSVSSTKSKKSKKKQAAATVSALTKKQIKKALLLHPPALTSFAQLRSRYRIAPRLAANIADQGYTAPTEVQLGSLPLLLGDCPDLDPATGRRAAAPPAKPAASTNEPDVLVVAPTGSGKTLAFMVPLISKVLRRHHEQPADRHVFAVVLAPTKELVLQIVNEGRKLTRGLGVKVTAMKKGMRLVSV